MNRRQRKKFKATMKYMDYIIATAAAYARLTEQDIPDEIRCISEMDENTIEFSWSAPCPRSCCTDYFSLSLPTQLLWEKNWEDRIRAEQIAKKAAQERQRAAEKEESLRRARRQERATYEALKAKFENEGSA